MTAAILTILGSLALAVSHWAAWYYGAKHQSQLAERRRKADLRRLSDALTRVPPDIDTIRRLLGE